MLTCCVLSCRSWVSKLLCLTTVQYVLVHKINIIFICFSWKQFGWYTGPHSCKILAPSLLGPNLDNWVGLGGPVQFSKVKTVSIQVRLCQNKIKIRTNNSTSQTRNQTNYNGYNYVILLHYWNRLLIFFFILIIFVILYLLSWDFICTHERDLYFETHEIEKMTPLNNHKGSFWWSWRFLILEKN